VHSMIAPLRRGRTARAGLEVLSRITPRPSFCWLQKKMAELVQAGRDGAGAVRTPTRRGYRRRGGWPPALMVRISRTFDNRRSLRVSGHYARGPRVRISGRATILHMKPCSKPPA
jgi:hypothetical protein